MGKAAFVIDTAFAIELVPVIQRRVTISRIRPWQVTSFSLTTTWPAVTSHEEAFNRNDGVKAWEVTKPGEAAKWGVGVSVGEWLMVGVGLREGTAVGNSTSSLATTMATDTKTVDGCPMRKKLSPSSCRRDVPALGSYHPSRPPINRPDYTARSNCT
jgi:hypothetical protein